MLSFGKFSDRNKKKRQLSLKLPPYYAHSARKANLSTEQGINDYSNYASLLSFLIYNLQITHTV